MHDVSTARKADRLPAAFGPPVLICLARTFAASALFFLCTTATAFAQRPPIFLPAATDVVVQRLPAGYGSLASTEAPALMTSAQLLSEAGTLLGASARTGDSRLAARADALLARFPASDDRSDVLRVRAFSAQHKHDFNGSLRILDRLVQREPRDGDARMSRAQVHLVQGRLDLARSDCAALVLGIDADDGMLCAASIAMRRGDFAAASGTLDRWLSQATPQDPRRGYATVMRAETAARAGDRQAERWFRDALASDPADVKTLAAFARWLRSVGRDRDVEPLLAATDVDGLQLQRALAAHAVGAKNAPALADAQQRRYATAHAVGSQPEMRDEAEFLLTLRDDPKGALALALKNFDAQRDVEDVDILTRAANAAGRPEVLEPVRVWAHAQGIALLPIAAASK